MIASSRSKKTNKRQYLLFLKNARGGLGARSPQVVTDGVSHHFYGVLDAGQLFHFLFIVIGLKYSYETIDRAKKMKVKTISYGRVLNLGNYESKRMEVTIEVNDDENIDQLSEQLQAWVEVQLKTKTETQTDTASPF